MDAPCGDYSQLCCPGGHCTNNDSYCENNRCIQCSYLGQQCCPFGTPLGMECQPGLTCVSGLCQEASTPPAPPPTDNTAAIVAGVAVVLGLAGLVYLDTTRGYY